MSTNNFFEPSHSEHLTIFDYQSRVEKTSERVERALQSKWKCRQMTLKDHCHQIPAYIRKHIQATQQLEQSIREFRDHQGKDIPQTVNLTFNKAQSLIAQVSRRIHCIEFLQLLVPSNQETSYLDPYHLLLQDSQHKRAVDSSHFEWHLNWGLLRGIYQRTQDAVLKKRLSFLILNYLAKAAPVRFDELSLETSLEQKLDQMFQHGLLEPSIGVVYNRESPVFDIYLRESINKSLAVASGNQFHVAGTKHIEPLLDLWFSLVYSSDTEDKRIAKWAEQITCHFHAYLNATHEHPLDQYIEPLLVFDLTSLLENFIYTEGDREKNQKFQEELEKISTQLNEAIQLVATQYATTPTERERLTVYLRSNSACICRCELKNIGILKILPVFYDPLYFQLSSQTSILSDVLSPIPDQKDAYARQLLDINLSRIRAKFENFMSGTGIRLGSVEGRQVLFEFMDLEHLIDLNEHQTVRYDAFVGPNAILYPTQLALTETRVFKQLEDKCTQKQLQEEHPYLQALGQSTLQLIHGLLSKIEDQKWKELHAHPDTCQLVQTTLARLLIHLGNANSHLRDFAQFTQNIELVHYDLAALITLFSPFTTQDFNTIHLNQLKIIPDELKPHAKAGLTRSSMNALAGVQVALKQLFTHPKFIYQKEAHFEIAGAMEERDYTLQAALNSSVSQFHLYVADFNHNIQLDPDHEEYQVSDVIGEIKALLATKQEIKHLTIALDCTIDYVQSEKVQNLLNHFAKDILQERLSFVLFSSGLKFYLLGMDNYYGAPVTVITRQTQLMEAYQTLFTHEAYQTDLLSHQWFCLVTQFAPEALDVYRHLIFNHTRQILAQVPASLKPGRNPFIKVCSVKEGMDPCFIDIKIKENKIFNTHDLKQLLFQKFADHQAKIHMRGGYGYYHPNVSFFPFLPKRYAGETIRIAPGLCPKETQLIINCLQDIALLIENS